MSYDILLREMLVSTFFSAWGAGNPRLVLNWIGDRGSEGAEGRSERGEVVLGVHAVDQAPRPPSNQMPHSASPIFFVVSPDRRGSGTIIYEGKEQIGDFVQALSPGFRSEVRQLKGRAPERGLYDVEAAVLITADPLRNVGIDAAGAAISARLSYASPLIIDFRLYFWQETFDKLEPILPPGQPAIIPDGRPLA